MKWTLSRLREKKLLEKWNDGSSPNSFRLWTEWVLEGTLSSLEPLTGQMPLTQLYGDLADLTGRSKSESRTRWDATRFSRSTRGRCHWRPMSASLGFPTSVMVTRELTFLTFVARPR